MNIRFQGVKQLNNESGTALVVALLVLVALTVLGLASINTSSIEIGISGNERVYRQNLNIAESASLHGLKEIQNMDSINDYDDLMPDTTSLVWLSNPGSSTFFEDPANWDYNDADSDDNAEQFSGGKYSYCYAVDYEGKQKGSSLKSGALSVNLYASYGLSQTNGGTALVNTGVKKPVRNP